MKTSELTGAALDWAVAKCEGIINGDDLDIGFILERGYTPSTNWTQGGPIIERKRISLVCCMGEYNMDKAGTPEAFDTYWIAEIGRQEPRENHGSQGDYYGTSFHIDDDGLIGPTPLIAAMRCYVASKLGDDVDIPEELL